ncbi:response regulator [Deinococcus altitudinis]|uniref:response regulator n=1 Tax=Deinococcus altitudinis TaxID=468914 RepID=UPI0038920CDF
MIDLLLIEPNSGVRKTLERLLETSGYSIRGVTRGTDALRQISRQRPDLVLSEVTLPDTGGLELCLQLQLSGLPVLLMSSGVNEQLRRDTQGAGALELLSKPLSESLLLSRLAHHLNLPVPPAPRVLRPSNVLGSLMTRPGMLGAVRAALNPAPQAGSGESSTPQNPRLVGPDSEEYLVLEELGRPVPIALYRAFLKPLTQGHAAAPQRGPATLTAAPDRLSPGARSAEDRGAEAAELQCIQLEYPEHCLLLFRLPGETPTVLVCLLQNSSYASLVKYYLQSSDYVRL